jgi:protease I
MTTEKKALIIIAPRNFRDEELTHPVHYLENTAIPYEIVSTSRGLAVGMMGGKVLIEKTISDISDAEISEFFAIIIIGGGGAPEYLWNNKSLISLIQKFDTAERIISAICLAPVVLAQAGVLQGKKATVWNEDQAIDEIRKGGAIFVSEPVVIDGRFITANGPNAAVAFGEKIVKAIQAA